jgi:hypothetical protein
MAITTAGDLIRKALGKLLVIGTQDTLTSGEMADGLDALNLMLDSWRLERLLLWAMKTDTHVLTGGQSAYTIGPGGDINTIRPTQIQNAFVRSANVDYPIDPIGQVQYDALAYKLTQGIPRKMFYNPGYPLGTINLYPVPLSSAYTLHVNSYGELESFSNIADVYSLAPGYARAVIFNLALELAPDFNKAAPPEVVKMAAQSKRYIKRVNSPDVRMSADAAILRDGGIYDITSDQFI